MFYQASAFNNGGIANGLNEWELESSAEVVEMFAGSPYAASCDEDPFGGGGPGSTIAGCPQRL